MRAASIWSATLLVASVAACNAADAPPGESAADARRDSATDSAVDSGDAGVDAFVPSLVLRAGGGAPGVIDGIGAAARFNDPFGFAVDGSGNVFVSDFLGRTIRKITSAGVVTTFAGAADTTGAPSADGTGPAARFNYPSGVALDGSGNVFVADTNNSTIRKITSAGVVTTFAGSAGSPGSADGMGAAARLNGPLGVVLDGAGNLFVSEVVNHTIRKVTSVGAVTTLAGTAGTRGSADGAGPAASFNGPSGLAVDGAGNVFVADYYNATIRKITATGVVTTFAGTAGVAGSADGVGAAARFNGPRGVAMSGAGEIFVTDTANSTVRKISSAGVVTTVVGVAGMHGTTLGPLPARLSGGRFLAVTRAGNLVLASDGAVLDVLFH